MHWIMLTILVQILPQILSLAIEERREQQFVAMTPNYNVVVAQEHFENYHYIKEHYNGENVPLNFSCTLIIDPARA